MLRVTFEIVPGGDDTKTREIGTLEIWNTGGSNNASLYSYEAKQNAPQPAPMRYSTICSGNGVVHDRRMGAFELVRKVLSCLPMSFGRFAP